MATLVPTWLRRLCGESAGPSPCRPAPRLGARPRLEVLEDRTVPTASPLPTDWAGPVGDRTNLYTGLSWHDATQETGYTYDLAGAKTTAANGVWDGFDDWRIPTKTEAQQAAVNGYGTQVFEGYVPSATYIWWTSTAAKGRYNWAVDLGDLAGSAVTALTDRSFIFATAVRDSGTVVDDGDAGYSATGFTTKSASGAFQGDQSTAAAGTGSKTATWTFTGLQAGASYKVTTTWKTVTGSASNAPFTIIDGGTAVAAVSVNERVAPADFSVNDTWWKGLGTYTITSSTLSVQLSNLADGTVLADAVRIFQVAPPPALLMAASAPPAPTASPPLSADSVMPLWQEALARWQAASVDTSSLANVSIRIADLGGLTLGMASGNTIWLDDDAAGWGWFVDRTPFDDSEFTTPGNQGEQGRMDLLSALTHEMGHLLGHDHDEGGVMGETLAAGTRLSVGRDVSALDAAFASWAGQGDLIRALEAVKRR